MSLWDFLSGNSAVEAANAENAAAQQAMGAVKQYGTQAQGYQQPYYQAGTGAMQNLAQQVQGGQYQYNPQFDFQADPGYQWQLQQGNNAIMGNAAAGGIQLSGATMKALQRYGQGLANQTYNQAFGRFANQRDYGAQQNQMQYGRMAGLSEIGQNSGNNMSNIANQQGQSVAQLYGAQGANTAAGIMGQANMQGNTLNSLLGLGGSVAGLFMGGKGGGSIPSGGGGGGSLGIGQGGGGVLPMQLPQMEWQP